MSDDVASLHMKRVGNGNVAPVIEDFLKWLDCEKKLTLCEPYKLQYQWYVPIDRSRELLLAEYLEARSVSRL